LRNPSKLPLGFERFDLTNEDGYIIALTVLVNGTIPYNFDKWKIANKDGISIAHYAAYGGLLNKKF
jgi:hypothetical protein